MIEDSYFLESEPEALDTNLIARECLLLMQAMILVMNLGFEIERRRGRLLL